MSHVVLVCGGRNYDNRSHVYAVLDILHKERPIDTIVHGGATGADALAREWAILRDVNIDGYRVDHNLDGPWPGAGPRRNARMLRQGKPDLVVAFPSDGPGTRNMLEQARKAGVPSMIEVEPDAAQYFQLSLN
jgi:hypothetical protein